MQLLITQLLIMAKEPSAREARDPLSTHLPSRPAAAVSAFKSFRRRRGHMLFLQFVATGRYPPIAVVRLRRQALDFDCY